MYYTKALLSKGMNGQHSHEHLLMQVYERVLDGFNNVDHIAGSFFWSLVGSAFPDCDGYSVRLLPRRKLSQSERTIEPVDIEAKEDTADLMQRSQGHDFAESSARSENTSAKISDMKNDHQLSDIREDGKGQSTCTDSSKELNLPLDAGSRQSPAGAPQKEGNLHQDTYRTQPAWLDQALVEIIKEHTQSIASLNGSWGCPMM